MLAIVCLELMVYVMPGDYSASRVKLLRFSIQQPLIDELISLTHTKEQLHNLFFKYLSTRSSDAGITLRLFGSQSLRLFYQFGVKFAQPKSSALSACSFRFFDTLLFAKRQPESGAFQSVL